MIVEIESRVSGGFEFSGSRPLRLLRAERRDGRIIAPEITETYTAVIASFNPKARLHVICTAQRAVQFPGSVELRGIRHRKARRQPFLRALLPVSNGGSDDR